jgi:hypothetical protein
LQHAVDAAAMHLGNDSAAAATAPSFDPVPLIADYQALRMANDEQTQLACERQAVLLMLVDLSEQQALKNSNLIATYADLTRVRDQLGQDRDAVVNQLARTKQENELLLPQLHQVQEELEHYFLRHQDAQRRVADADHRWARMLQRSPAYCDFDSIDVIAAEASEAGDQSATVTATWRIGNLTAAGRNLPQLDFKTVVGNGLAGYVITRQDGTAGPLIRWPVAAADQTELNLVFTAAPAQAMQEQAILHGIATADWDLLQTMGRLLDSALDNAPDVLNAPANFQPQALRTGLGKLADSFAQFASTLRFDTVSLKREQVNPDYEHLWLRLSNLGFAGKRWAEFEFRLSCANVRPKKFATHPKLEFPEHIGQAPFTAWFDESFDDFGAKMELRFALADAMDIAVWQRLSDPDRTFLEAHIARLPAILATLEVSGTKLRRAWADWIAMAVDVQRVLTLRMAALELALRPVPPIPAPVLSLVPVTTSVAAKPSAAAKTRKAK